MSEKVYQSIHAKQVMNRVKEPRMPFDWSINPYRGCAHGCSFCYARPTHTFLGMTADDAFQHHILIKANAADALEQQLARMFRRHQGDVGEAIRQIGMVALGTATDPYQPVEGKAAITRQCLEVLARYRVPVSITTRSPLILRDLDLLRELWVVSINISLNTTDPVLSRRLEPAAPLPAKRLETVAQLAAHKLPAGVFMAPILPFLTDGEEAMESVIAAAKAHQAAFVSPSALRLAPEVKEWYYGVLREHYPGVLPDYMALYRGTYPREEYGRMLGERVRNLLHKHEMTGLVPQLDLSVLDQALQSDAGSICPPGGEQLQFDF